MDVQTLVILFLIFSAISSLISRLQRQKIDESKLERKPRSARDPFEEEEEDWSDWDVFAEPEPKPEPKPVPVVRETPKPTVDTEYRDIQVRHPVVQAEPKERPMSLLIPKPATKGFDPVPAQEKTSPERRRPPTVQKKRTRRPKLSFNAQTVRQAIIYNEILGPPRSEQEYP